MNKTSLSLADKTAFNHKAGPARLSPRVQVAPPYRRQAWRQVLATFIAFFAYFCVLAKGKNLFAKEPSETF